MTERKQQYVIWIRDITDWYSKIPTWSVMEEKHFYFLEKFTKGTLEYNYPINYSLQPNAIFNLND